MPFIEDQNKTAGCKESVEKALLGCGILCGMIGCLSRADYNLPIFLFTYVTVNIFKSKSADGDKDIFWCMLLLAFSFLIDVLFFTFVYFEVWKSTEYEAIAKWEDNLHDASAMCCIINMGIKAAYIIFKFCADGKKLWHGFLDTFCCCFVAKHDQSQILE